MKIAFVTSHINKSLQWFWFSRELSRRQVDQVHIIINEYEPMLASDLRQLGIPVYYLVHKNFLSHFINLIRVVRILRLEKVDIVHTSLPFGNLIGQVAAAIARVRQRVSTCENASWAHDFKSSKQKLIDKLTYRLAGKVIAVSDSAKEYLETYWNLNSPKLTMIYHGLDVAEYEDVARERVEKLRESLAVSPGDFVLGVIARFEYWKGHIYIIEAVKEIVADHPDIKVFILGSMGPEYENVMSKVKEYGLTDNVFYKGFVDDPVALFQLFDVHIHVPINKYVENCGINIIEGMISARPQILTRSGYAYTAAKNMDNCIVVDYCNASQIADAILLLKSNHDLALRLGSQALQDARNHFSLEAKVDRHLELYRAMTNATEMDRECQHQELAN